MKNRFALAAIIGLMAMLVLFVQVSQRGSSRRNAIATANKDVSSSSLADSRSEVITGASTKKESIRERRKRMISNEGYHDDLKLSEQEVYMYVQSKGSNALSLVTAFESTRDKEYLKAAAAKFPDDPFVQAKALLWLDMTDVERANLREAFKRSSPSNSFANFLAARDAVKRGDIQAAYMEVMAAKGKTYDEFDRESAQGLGDAYLFAGRSEAEAKTLGMAEVTLPQLAEFKKVGREFLALAERSGAAGDTKAQQDLLLTNWQLGNQMRSGGAAGTLITELVGIAIENLTLRSPMVGAEFNGQQTSELLAANNADTKDLRSGTPLFEKWFPTAPDEEIITYMDTTLKAGERQAVQWLKQQHPELVLDQANN